MSDKQPLGPNQERWIQALESGKWKQGYGQLRRSDDSFCCLGVACEVAKIPGTVTRGSWDYGAGNDAEAPDSLVDMLALYSSVGRPSPMALSSTKSLAELNDGNPALLIQSKSFSEIAAIIRNDPSIYFREPR